MKLKCKCKESFTFSMNGPTFEGDKWYDYEIIEHRESKVDVYYVQSQYENFPMLGGKFHKHFDDIQKRREDAINQILS